MQSKKRSEGTGGGGEERKLKGVLKSLIGGGGAGKPRLERRKSVSKERETLHLDEENRSARRGR